MITIELSELEDSRTVLKNPHKGWYWHYVDNGFSRPKYSDRGYDRIDEFPGINHLYIRFDWSDIQPECDKFDWSPIDTVMDEWSRKGFRFSFRACCCEGPKQNKFASPKWLYEKGCGGSFNPPPYCENPEWWDNINRGNKTEKNDSSKYCKAWEPDYGDKIFLEYLEKFICAFAEKFDGNPLVEYVDVGSYGTWGEGHTWAASHKVWNTNVLKKHIELHKKYFKSTPVVVNDDMINSALYSGDVPILLTEEKRRHLKEHGKSLREDFADYCVSKGLGLRDDSVLVGNRTDGSYDTVRSPDLFNKFFTNGLIDIESEHYANIKPETFKGGFPLLEALKNCHADFAGFHAYPDDFLNDNPWLCEYAANRLGYWYFIKRVSISEKIVLKKPINVNILWENRGFGVCTKRYSLEICFTDLSTGNNYTFIQQDFDNRKILPGVEFESRHNVCLPYGISQGKYELAVRMYEESSQTDIRLALNTLRSDGFYSLCKVDIHK